MFPVKICGIANRESLEIVLKFPVSAIGLIFYSQSTRFIDLNEAEKLRPLIPESVKTVGVFVNETTNTIISIAKRIKLDFIQLHGNEFPEFCAKLPLPVIKAVRVGPDFSPQDLDEFDVHAFLLDTYQPGLFGGTGESFNWNLIQNLESETPIILSGGLKSENISDGIENVKPVAIDVNSGVESCPGQKDENRVSKLFEKLKNKTCKNNIFRITENV